MADAEHEEFPSTGVAWQEPAGTAGEDAPPTGRPVDRFSLAIGVVFALLAIAGMTGVDGDGSWLWGGHLLWLALLLAGAVLLVAELRRTRRRQ